MYHVCDCGVNAELRLILSIQFAALAFVQAWQARYPGGNALGQGKECGFYSLGICIVY